MHFVLKNILLLTALVVCNTANAQLTILPQNNAQALAQKLVGDGVVISNVTLTSSTQATGFFWHESGTKIGLDSGIVLTNGRVNSQGGNNWGVDGNGNITAMNALASLDNLLPGDGDIARQLSIPVNDTYDATVLEFDFVPLGDSIKFRYVFSSEEYTEDYVCQFNDAFAFFISGPGIVGGVRNIALVPGTNTPVSIFNVNDVLNGACPNNISYFVDNTANKFFTHDGHTTVLTALEKVQPCQTYHLKLVITDVGDGVFDSGVFLEAKSLSSNVVSLQQVTQVDAQNNNYLVEGCATGQLIVKRPNADNAPLNVTLLYAGSAVNGTDVQLLPLNATIPANQKSITINILPIIDNLPEGTELLKIYALGGCNATTPSDSAIIQIRDYDTLGIQPEAAIICKNASLQLTASAGYSVYQWDANATLSNASIRTPVATPVNAATKYYCTATEGTCKGRDSAIVILKLLDFVSKTEINCRNGITGIIKVSGGGEWAAPVEYSINNNAYQADSTFTGLSAGTYTVRIKDATGCIDSLTVTLSQLYPDLLINPAPVTAASCSGNADGTITVTATGGNAPYLFSSDGINFQTGNVLFVTQGNHDVTIRDINGCSDNKNVIVPLNNTVTLDAGTNKTICEGKAVMLNAVSNGQSFMWAPAASLDNAAVINPVAAPVVTTKYYITAQTGICAQTDSVTVFVNPAPKPNAGADRTICFEEDAQLNGTGGIAYWWYPTSYLSNARIDNPLAKKLPGTITYALHVTDANGCNSLKSDSVVITVTRPAIVSVGRDTAIAVGQPLQLNAVDVNNVGFSQYSWSPAYGLNNAIIYNPVTVLDKDVQYIITAATPFGCEGKDTINVKAYRGPEIYVPNAFTPNGDGKNDLLKAIPVGIQQFYYFRIYNRWGNLVFNTANAVTGWDGKVKGASSPSGTYTWIAEAKDYKGNILQRRGTVILLH